MILLFSDDHHLHDSLVVATDRHLPVRAESRPAEFARWDLLVPLPVSLILADLRHASPSDLSGLEQIVRHYPRVPVLAVVRDRDTDVAFATGDLGCDGVISEPIDAPRLRARITRVIRRTLGPDSTETEALDLRNRIVGSSPVMDDLRRRIVRVARSSVSVLVHGETGSGKELVAQAVHRSSPRADGPFVPVNCAAIPEAVFEPELFGARRGAFTDARDRDGLVGSAAGGTLFLDELAELPRLLQAKMLRVLESGEVRPVGAAAATPVDFRLIAATNAALADLRSGARVRLDLWYRVADVVLEVPPLRERREDLEELSYTLLRREGFGDVRLGPSALSRLREHHWPGNVRELRSTLVRSIAFSGASTLAARDIALPDAGISGAARTGLSPAVSDRRPE